MTKYEIALQQLQEIKKVFNEEMKALELKIELLEDTLFEIQFIEWKRLNNTKKE